MKYIFNLFDLREKIDLRTEILAGITVSVSLIPEAIAFSLVAGLSPLTGLYAAFTMGLVTSIFGGRPGMISGAAGAIAIIIVALAKTHGPEYIFATAILAGIIQMLAGIFKLGKFIRLVPQSVMYGFVNGLAIIIFLSQITQFKWTDPGGSLHWMTGTPLLLMVGLVLFTMLIIWKFPKITKAFPSPLAAILVVTGLVLLLNLDTRMLGDIASVQGGFPPFNIPKIPYTLETLNVIFPYALMVAAVGLVESLLTMNLIDEITETRGWGNKEAIAQGAGNTLSGFFSGMGGCALIGQSLINISSGGRTRISGIIASLVLLVLIMFGSGIIERIPMAALTGVMMMVAIGTFEWTSLRTFKRMPKPDIIVMVVVTLITVFMHNLALAVLIGVAFSALVFAWENAKRIRARKYVDEHGIKHYEIYGPLFFGSVSAFNEKFEIANDPEEVIIDFSESRVADMSGIEALNKITERYRKLGKKLHLRHLSSDCLQLLDNANEIIEVNILEDPTYKVVVDRRKARLRAAEAV
jgi:SulP family sulfate permease